MIKRTLIVATFVAAVLALSGCNANGSLFNTSVSASPSGSISASPAPSATTTPGPSQDPKNADDSTKIDLSVDHLDLIPEEARCNSDVFNMNSLPSNRADMVYGDSVTVAFASNVPSEMIDEVLYENCTNITVLDMNIRAAYNIPIDATHTLGQINAWWMDSYLAQVPEGVDLRSWTLTKKIGEGNKLFVTAGFQQYAELMNTVLLRFKATGVYDELSITNWHIPSVEGLRAGEIPRVQINNETEESLAALHLEYTIKGSACGPIRIGFNLLDKRFEVFSTDCTPPTPTPTAPTPKINRDCASEYPGYPYGIYPVCKDGAGRIPGQGNTHNLPGGQGIAPDQADPLIPPTGGIAGPVYVAPSATTTGGQPQGSTPTGEETSGNSQSGGDGIN